MMYVNVCLNGPTLPAKLAMVTWAELYTDHACMKQDLTFIAVNFFTAVKVIQVNPHVFATCRQFVLLWTI